jgi:protein involved in polysaccharide export with SLBB domain
MAGWAATVLILAGCFTSSPPLPPPPPPTPPDTNLIATIPLQNGEQVEVALRGTPTPIEPITMTLNGAGTISLPLLQTNIPAIGKSPHELEDIITALYVPKVFTTISVTVTPGPRYYYVTGEVIHTENAKQLYTGKVTVLGAISAVGGFNNFAARNRVQLTRQNGTIFIEDCNKALKNPKLDLEVLPNDKIFVDKQTWLEAFFGK